MAAPAFVSDPVLDIGVLIALVGGLIKWIQKPESTDDQIRSLVASTKNLENVSSTHEHRLTIVEVKDAATDQALARIEKKQDALVEKFDRFLQTKLN